MRAFVEGAWADFRGAVRVDWPRLEQRAFWGNGSPTAPNYSD